MSDPRQPIEPGRFWAYELPGGWQVLAGRTARSLSPVGSAADRGFETRISLASSANTFEVRALSSGGRVLATSKPVSGS